MVSSLCLLGIKRIEMPHSKSQMYFSELIRVVSWKKEYDSLNYYKYNYKFTKYDGLTGPVALFVIRIYKNITQILKSPSLCICVKSFPSCSLGSVNHLWDLQNQTTILNTKIIQFTITPVIEVKCYPQIAGLLDLFASHL